MFSRALNNATPTKALRQAASAAASSPRGFLATRVMSADMVEVMQDAGELERLLGYAARVRRGEMGAGRVAVVARHRPHRKLGDVGVGLGVVHQGLRIGEREH